MPVELLVAVLLLLGVIVVVLLLWVSRADHVTLHWSRHLQSVFSGLRPQTPVQEVPAVRRRPLYVAERRVAARETTPSTGTEPTGASPPGATGSAAPGPVPRTLHSTPLPLDLAALLSRPAALTPRSDTYGFGSTERADSDGGAVAEAGHDGANVLARHAETPRGDSPSSFALDPLTGLEGPGSWSRIIGIENARLLRYRRPVTVVMAEVDGLRRLADRLGEEPVERLLPVIADTLRREARSSDWVAKVGSARFAALLPETDEIQAINYVERIRIVCEPWLTSSAVPLRLAIGWSSPGASTDLEYAVRRAEERMHADRRAPGKPLQPSHVAPARVVSLSAGSPAAEGLADLTEASVAPAETNRSAQRDGASVAPPPDAVEPDLEAARGRSWPRPTEPAPGDEGAPQA